MVRFIDGLDCKTFCGYDKIPEYALILWNGYKNNCIANGEQDFTKRLQNQIYVNDKQIC